MTKRILVWCLRAYCLLRNYLIGKRHPIYRKYVFAQGTQQERENFYQLSKQINQKSYVERSALLNQLKSLPADDFELPPISKDVGYVIVTPPEIWPELDNAIAEGRKIFQQPVPVAVDREDDSLTGIPRKDRTHTSALIKFAMSRPIVAAVANYFGYLPVLYRINALYSRNDRIHENSSQFFHLDPEDIRQVKIFLYINDVDTNSGPLCLLNAQASTRVSQILNYRTGRLPDKTIFDLVGRAGFIECTGAARTLIFVDTSRCYHFGSRQGGQPRKAIMVQYVSPFAALFPLTGAKVTTPMGHVGVPNPSEIDEYLLAMKR